MTEFDLNEPDPEDLTDQQLSDWLNLVIRSQQRYETEIRRRIPPQYCPECGGIPHGHEPWCYVSNGKKLGWKLAGAKFTVGQVYIPGRGTINL